LTLHASLGLLRAPHFCVLVLHPSPRAQPVSPGPVCGLLHARFPAFRAAHGGLRAQHFELAPRTPALSVSGLLRIPRLSAPRSLADCSAPSPLALSPVRRLLRSRFLTFRAGLRIAPYAHPLRPCAAYGLLRAQHLKLRPVRGSLRARHLAAEFRSRIAPLPSLCALQQLRIAPRLPL